jgi:uncharacterized protein YndB with AHSA1/START domain
MTAARSSAEVRRRFGATPEQVFAAFADARLVGRWLKPAPEIALTVLQFEFRVGGAYRFAYQPPGQPTVIVFGAYRTIEPPSKLAFSWLIEPPDVHAGIESEVTVTITPQAGGAELVIRHDKLGPAEAVLRHDQGWRGALDHLSALLEIGNDL